MPSQSPPLYPAQTKLIQQLGIRLREAQLRRRLSVSLLAERVGVSRPTISKVEKGNPTVTLGTYLRVLAVLGLQEDLALVAQDEKVSRRLQDAGFKTPHRAPKQFKPQDTPDSSPFNNQ